MRYVHCCAIYFALRCYIILHRCASLSLCSLAAFPRLGHSTTSQDRKIATTSFLDSSFMKTLASAIRFGTPLLVQVLAQL